jgi:hypothetical protein
VKQDIRYILNSQHLLLFRPIIMVAKLTFFYTFAYNYLN